MKEKEFESTGHDVIHRWEKNPIISLDDLSFACMNIFNAGAIKYKDKYLLLLRIETLRGPSIFVRAVSSDGNHFEVDPEAIMFPAEKEPFRTYEARGVEDPRITFIDNTYYIVYVANSSHGRRLALAETADFKTIKRIALISEPDNNGGALFHKKINNRYVRLERPNKGGSIWISYSDDLIYWGRATVILTPRRGYWDSSRIGIASPPIEIEGGWLVIYYGEKDTSTGPIYRLGAALLDAKNPAKVLGRSDIPILSPRKYYERVGDTDNVVFSCGVILEEKTNVLKLYYGVSNAAICLGTANLDKIVGRCFKS